MKKRLIMAGLTLAAVVVVALKVWGSTYLAIGNLTTVNNTTSNMTAQVVASLNLPNGTFSLQHGTMANTNDIVAALQFSLDNTNFITVGTWRSANIADTTTNGESWSPALAVRSVYMRLSVTTTNSQTIGATATF